MICSKGSGLKCAVLPSQHFIMQVYTWSQNKSGVGNICGTQHKLNQAWWWQPSTRTGLHGGCSYGHSENLSDGFHNPNQHCLDDIYAHLCSLMPEKKKKICSWLWNGNGPLGFSASSLLLNLCTHSAAHHQYLPYSQHCNDDKRLAHSSQFEGEVRSSWDCPCHPTHC